GSGRIMDLSLRRRRQRARLGALPGGGGMNGSPMDNGSGLELADRALGWETPKTVGELIEGYRRKGITKEEAVLFTANRLQHAGEDVADENVRAAVETVWPPANGASPHEIRFLTARELALTGSIDPDWIIHGWAARQWITEVDGKVKAAGKTTLLMFAIRAVLDGTPFLRYPTQRTGVVLLSEQQSGPLLTALYRAGLHDRDGGLRILLRSMFAGLGWQAIVERARDECRATDAGLLVVDTIGKLAGIHNENEAGEWSAA